MDGRFEDWSPLKEGNGDWISEPVIGVWEYRHLECGTKIEGKSKLRVALGEDRKKVLER